MEENEAYNRIRTIIDNLIKDGIRKIAIAPFGRYGLLAKQILNWQYGITEEYIVDNGLSDINKKIYSLDNFLKLSLDDDLVVILATQNIEVITLFTNKINTIWPDIRVISIYDIRLRYAKNAACYIKELREVIGVKGVIGPNRFQRFGRDGDGGYIAYNDISRDVRAYSFGVGNDVSWEKSFIRYGKDVHLYDPTVDELPEKNERFHFHKLGIAGEDSEEELLLSMVSILKMNDDYNNDNLVLKMDVEGAEWEFINSTPSEVLDKFIQISFELHGLKPNIVLDDNMIMKALVKLNRTHQAVWVHGNNCGTFYKDKEELLPELLEITYLNKRYYKFTEAHSRFPWEIDCGNKASEKDYYLSKW